MNRLKELTWEHHKEAERQGFVKVLLSGKIHPEFYATYLWNQYQKYELLESIADENCLLQDLSEIKRAGSVKKDFQELWPYFKSPAIMPSVHEYTEHLGTKSRDSHAIMAHIYVLHMGDLSGGQMIANRVPGEGRLYQFGKDINELKEGIRLKTNDSMADEARTCFSFATKLFQDLMETECERYLERTD